MPRVTHPCGLKVCELDRSGSLLDLANAQKWAGIALIGEAGENPALSRNRESQI